MHKLDEGYLPKFNKKQMDQEEKIGCLFILLMICFIIFIVFVVFYIRLARFKNCYDNSFKFNYCEKYKNY